MNEIRSHFVASFSIVPIILVLSQIKNASFILLQCTLTNFIKQ